jgi:hypothetical protein
MSKPNLPPFNPKIMNIQQVPGKVQHNAARHQRLVNYILPIGIPHTAQYANIARGRKVRPALEPRARISLGNNNKCFLS